jgi:hypothetical protein
MVRDPKRPSDFLGGILRDAKNLATRSETQKALTAVLGDEIAIHCRIAGMSAGKLIVEVDSAPLYAELKGFRSEEIRQAMNERLGGRKLGHITFRPGRSRSRSPLNSRDD